MLSVFRANSTDEIINRQINTVTLCKVKILPHIAKARVLGTTVVEVKPDKKLYDTTVSDILKGKYGSSVLAIVIRKDEQIDFIFEYKKAPEEELGNLRVMVDTQAELTTNHMDAIIQTLCFVELKCENITAYSSMINIVDSKLCNTCESISLEGYGFESVDYIRIRGRGLKKIKISLGNMPKIESLSNAFSLSPELEEVDFSGTLMPNLLSCEAICERTKVKRINLEVLGAEKLENTSHMFWVNKEIKEFNMQHLGNNLKSVMSMFHRCMWFEKLEIDWKQLSNIRDISFFLEGASIGGTIHIKDVVFTQLNSVSSTFSETNVEQVIFENVSFPELESAYNIFKGCKKLKTVKFINCNFDLLEDMSGIFHMCDSLEKIEIDEITKESLSKKAKTSLRDMFNSSGIKEVDLSFMTATGSCDLRRIFSGCHKLSKAKMVQTKFDPLDKEVNEQKAQGIFEACESLREIELNNFKSSTCNLIDMFYRCLSLEKLEINNWYVPNAKDLRSFLCGCVSLRSLKMNDWVIAEDSNIVEVGDLFRGCERLEVVDTNIFDEKSLESSKGMFKECVNLRYIDLHLAKIYRSFDSLTNTNNKIEFNTCKKLETIKLPKVDIGDIVIDLSQNKIIKNITMMLNGLVVDFKIDRSINKSFQV